MLYCNQSYRLASGVLNHNAMTIIFARPRAEYQSYSDFWRLVNLSNLSEIQVGDQLNWQNPDTTLILTPATNELYAWDIPQQRRIKIIHWQLERGASTDPHDMAFPRKHPLADEMWVSDAAFAAVTGARYVFMGGHQAFGSVRMRERYTHDFTTLAYMTPRRTAVVHDLQGRGLSWADQDGGAWGQEREDRLNTSRVMVNVHQDDQAWHEPLRFAVASCYAVPIISETCAGPGLFEANRHYLDVPLDEIGATVERMLQHGQLLNRLAASAWRLCCVDHTFEREVREAVGE